MSDLEKKDKRKHKTTLIIVLIFIIITTIELIIFIPKIKQSVVDSGVQTIIKDNIASKSSNKMETLTLYYTSLEGKPIKYTTTIEREYDLLHDTFEHLFKPTPKSVLDGFNVSYIPTTVELLGATQTDDAIYVDVSNSILKSKNMEYAYEAIKTTALAFNPKSKFVLLIEGEVYDNSNF